MCTISHIQWDYGLGSTSISVKVSGVPSGFGGLGVSVLASGTQVRGFKPGQSRRIFKGRKFLSAPSFRREEK
jgi:hypothetical protein